MPQKFKEGGILEESGCLRSGEQPEDPTQGSPLEGCILCTDEADTGSYSQKRVHPHYSRKPQHFSAKRALMDSVGGGDGGGTPGVAGAKAGA